MSTPNTPIVVEEPKPVKLLAFVLNLVAGLLLMLLMLITFIDVVGRTLHKPLEGSIELTQITLCLIIFTILPLISWRNENVVVDILDSYFSPKLDFIRTVIFHGLAAIALGFLGQRLMVLGARSLSNNEITEYRHIPVGWAINFMGVMCWFTAACLVTLGVYYAYRRYQIQLAAAASPTSEVTPS